MFKDNLQKFRKSKGYSQSELAAKLFVTRQCISKWESGATQPDIETLSKLSEILEVSADELLSVENNVSEKVEKKSRSNLKLFLMNNLTALFSVLLIVILWRYLPDIIPAHYTEGKIDRYGSKHEIFLHIVSVIVFLFIDVILYIVFRKRPVAKAVFIGHLTLTAIQICYIVFVVVLYCRYLNDILSFLTCTSCDLLLVVSVGMHPKISERNFLIGSRTEETSDDPLAWKKANLFSCYLSIAVSAILLIVNIALSYKLSYLSLLAYVGAGVVAVVYAKIAVKK